MSTEIHPTYSEGVARGYGDASAEADARTTGALFDRDRWAIRAAQMHVQAIRHTLSHVAAAHGDEARRLCRELHAALGQLEVRFQTTSEEGYSEQQRLIRTRNGQA